MQYCTVVRSNNDGDRRAHESHGRFAGVK